MRMDKQHHNWNSNSSSGRFGNFPDKSVSDVGLVSQMKKLVASKRSGSYNNDATK